MKEFFIDLKAVLEAITTVQHVNKWRNQHLKVIEGKMELFQYPAVFIEFDSTVPTNAQSLGGGIQIYNVKFKLHLLSWVLDSADGDFEKDLEIYDLQDEVYLKVQKFYPGATNETDPVGHCDRVGYSEDYEWSHAGVTHMIQEWDATIVDRVRQEPINGVLGPEPPVQLDVNVEVDGTVDPESPHPYTFTPTI